MFMSAFFFSSLSIIVGTIDTLLQTVGSTVCSEKTVQRGFPRKFAYCVSVSKQIIVRLNLFVFGSCFRTLKDFLKIFFSTACGGQTVLSCGLHCGETCTRRTVIQRMNRKRQKNKGGNAHS